MLVFNFHVSEITNDRPSMHLMEDHEKCMTRNFRDMKVVRLAL